MLDCVPQRLCMARRFIVKQWKGREKIRMATQWKSESIPGEAKAWRGKSTR